MNMTGKKCTAIGKHPVPDFLLERSQFIKRYINKHTLIHFLQHLYIKKKLILVCHLCMCTCFLVLLTVGLELEPFLNFVPRYR